MFPHVNQRSELFSTLINLHHYGDADRKELSQTSTPLYLDCVGLQDSTTVKSIEMAHYIFLNYRINVIKNKVFLDPHEDHY